MLTGASRSKPAYSFRNMRRMVSMGPFLCLPMMISATPSDGMEPSSSSLISAIPYDSGRCTNMTTSLSCSIAPEL
ncbi:hypothetical protein D3C83_142330 [compost metagenome]